MSPFRPKQWHPGRARCTAPFLKRVGHEQASAQRYPLRQDSPASSQCAPTQPPRAGQGTRIWCLDPPSITPSSRRPLSAPMPCPPAIRQLNIWRRRCPYSGQRLAISCRFDQLMCIFGNSAHVSIADRVAIYRRLLVLHQDGRALEPRKTLPVLILNAYETFAHHRACPDTVRLTVRQGVACDFILRTITHHVTATLASAVLRHINPAPTRRTMFSSSFCLNARDSRAD